ncbi:MAG TPA: carbamoyltransferase N-terminal domain-containing protein, partial [Acidobacteriota bacterium]
MKTAILGLSAYYHDSAAALLVDGDIVAAAHEERFSRRKHDARFPTHATRYVLGEAGLRLADLTAIAFYDKPYLKFERLLETYHAFAPRGFASFRQAMPVWLKEKLFLRRLLWRELENCDHGGTGMPPPLTRSFPATSRPATGGGVERRSWLAAGRRLRDRRERPPLLFPEHHLSHAASAFYPGPFERAAILTMDGVGEWATTTIGAGDASGIRILRELHFPHSIGLLYSAFTYYCGFRVNSGEYKLMGLAPYGAAGSDRVSRFRKLILDHLVDLRSDGSLLLDMSYFDYATGLRMCNDEQWERLFGIPKRAPESELTQPYMDMALAIQQVTEEIVLRLARTARQLTGCNNLVMAGGVALNCVANGKLLREGIFDEVWIQPAAGDAGGALGAAYAALHLWKGERRRRPASVTAGGKPNHALDAMKGALLGPSFTDADVVRLQRRYGAPGRRIDDFDELC